MSPPFNPLTSLPASQDLQASRAYPGVHDPGQNLAGAASGYPPRHDGECPLPHGLLHGTIVRSQMLDEMAHAHQAVAVIVSQSASKLPCWQRVQERFRVVEAGHGGKVPPNGVLVVSAIHPGLDSHAGIDHSQERRRDSHVRGAPSVHGRGEPRNVHDRRVADGNEHFSPS